MRSTTSAEDVLLALGKRAHRGRVRIDDGTGSFTDMTTLLGTNWLRSFAVKDSVDSATMTANVVLHRQTEDLLSIAPLIDGSRINAGGTLVDIAHELVIEVATLPLGVAPASGDWKELFRGHIDEVGWSGPVTLACRDLGGDLMDTFIITQRVYGSATGEDIEEVIQDILDDANPDLETITANYTWNGTTTVTMSDTSEVAVGDYIGYLTAPMFKISAIVPNTSVTILNPSSRTIPTGSGANSSILIAGGDRVTLYSVTGDATTPFKVADTPGWALKSFKSGRDHLLPRVRALAQQIGWECRYRWNSNVSAFVLTLYEPDRTKSTPDWTHGTGMYMDPTRLSISRATIRNWVEVTYGKAGSRTTTIQQNTASQTKYGFRPMAISEASSSQIDTLTEANAMASAALADLKDPTAIMEVPVPFFWPLQTGDLERFAADNRRFDSNQDLAVVAFDHQFKEGGGAFTKMTVRGQPSGGVKRWLEIEGRAGVAPSPDHQSDESADNVSVTAGMGTLVVEYDDPRTMDPPVDDWALTECHVNAGSGTFTPGSSTLKDIGRRTRFQIDGLVPGDTYSVILRILDAAGNIGAETTFVAHATQRVGPYHENNDGQFDQLIRNPDLNIYTLDKTSNPPDSWYLPASTWGSSGDWYYTESDMLTGSRAAVAQASSEYMYSKRIPFQGGDVVQYGVVLKAINITGTPQGRIWVFGYNSGGSSVWNSYLDITASASFQTVLSNEQVHDDVRELEVRLSRSASGGDIVFDRALVQRGHANLWARKLYVADQQSYTSGTLKVTFPYTVYDDGFDESTADEWTARSPGMYVFDAVLSAYKISSFTGQLRIDVDTGSGFNPVQTSDGVYVSSASELRCRLSHIVELSEGDSVRASFTASSTCTIQHVDTDNQYSTLKARQLTRVD